MRHDKISPDDHAILPSALAQDGADTGRDAEEKGDKRPPVALQHFYFCGRAPSRKRTEANSVVVPHTQAKHARNKSRKGKPVGG